MTPEHKIAYHHLGDMLRRVDRQGSRYQVVCDDGAIDHPPTAATGSTAAEAAADCASQLRAGGWEPSHARLEWQRDGDAIRLLLRIDGWQHPVLSGQFFDNGSGWIGNEQQDIAGYPATAAHISRQVQRWHDATFRSLHLPPFPGASDAT